MSGFLQKRGWTRHSVLAGGRAVCIPGVFGAALFALGKVCATPFGNRVAGSRCHANSAGLALRVVSDGRSKSVGDFLTTGRR